MNEPDAMPEPIQPAPRGRALVAPVTCTADPAAEVGVQHHLLIHPDWTVEARDHDLAAERVAATLDAWCSCLHAADVVVPMARTALQLASDTPIPSAALDRRRTPAPHDMRATHQFGIVPLAVASRDEGRARAERRLLDELLLSIGNAWRSWGDPNQVDGGHDGFDELWRVGIAPARADRIARMFPRASWPLPVGLFMAAQFGTIDLYWLSSVVTCYPEHAFVHWVIARGSRASNTAIDEIWRMYGLGLSADDVMSAIDTNVSVDALAALADLPTTTVRNLASWLTLCAELGVRPTRAHWGLLAEQGVLRAPPPAWAGDTFVRRLQAFDHAPHPRMEIVVMLALCPDVDAIRAAIQDGIRSALDARFIETLTRKALP